MKNNRIIIIGNGFDLHHDLKTRYKCFKNFVYDLNPGLVNDIDEIFKERWGIQDDIDKWSSLEEMLSELPNFDAEDEYMQAFASSEMDMDRASYWHDPKLNIDIASKELLKPLELKKYFDDWIESLEEYLPPKSKLVNFKENDIFISFNYTNTLEKVYDISSNRILYIHGNKNSEYILGHNTNFELPISNPHGLYINEDGMQETDYDIRHMEVNDSINEIYEKLYYKYFKNSNEIIMRHSKWFDLFENADEVIIMGLDLGPEDEHYIEEISLRVKEECKVIIYYHEDLEEMKKKVSKHFSYNETKFMEW